MTQYGINERRYDETWVSEFHLYGKKPELKQVSSLLSLSLLTALA